MMFFIDFKFIITMKNVYLFELNDIFDDQVYLPYSNGVVWSYVKNGTRS
jgi:hypothetical protein